MLHSSKARTDMLEKSVDTRETRIQALEQELHTLRAAVSPTRAQSRGYSPRATRITTPPQPQDGLYVWPTTPPIYVTNLIPTCAGLLGKQIKKAKNLNETHCLVYFSEEDDCYYAGCATQGGDLSASDSVLFLLGTYGLSIFPVARHRVPPFLFHRGALFCSPPCVSRGAQTFFLLQASHFAASVMVVAVTALLR